MNKANAAPASGHSPIGVPPSSGHSPIGASSYSRWSACPGSVRLCKDVQSIPSSYALEGTRAHELGENRLRGAPFPNNIDDETLAAVSVYTNWILDQVGPEDVLMVEQGFDLGVLYKGLWGTADAVIWKPQTRTLIVVDYKHGRGVPVEIEKNGKANVQLAYYALGALLHTNYPAETIQMVVVQPRCPHPMGAIRSVQLSAIDLLDFADDLIRDAKKTEDPHAKLVAGEHCGFCPAAGKCPEIQNKALRMAQNQFQPSTMHTEKVKQLPELLPWLSVLESWIENVRSFAYSEAKSGRAPTGYKLVAKRGTRKWKNELEARRFLELHYRSSREFFTIPELKSVAQIEKLIPKENVKDLEPLYELIVNGDKLVPESEPGEPINNLLKAQKEFMAISKSSHELFD